ncbi:L-rhamnose mutarotase [Streptomyces sp. HNM0663]|uniref:L-rhamnose mutarotase n=1 Tax=Streptomyces chengmaiensis TaxID=3040919 RepID=A0ABT6HZI0_9ACTN|nr:L-rhamnose mutarotase [Streptomyces chengmaiensis]MDH2394116.1 L-rhamnose mutarotase [Streptomyces chengmaiensis]
MGHFRPVILVTVLREGKELAYEAAHQQIPEDLFAALTGGGVRDWAIWRDGRTLLHLVDIDDYAALEKHLTDDPVNDRWQAEMAVYVERFDEVGQIPMLEAPRLVWSMRRQMADNSVRGLA